MCVFLGHLSSDNPTEAGAWVAGCVFLGHLSHDNPTEAAAWAGGCVFLEHVSHDNPKEAAAGCVFLVNSHRQPGHISRCTVRKKKLNSNFFSPVTSYSNINA